MATCLCNSSLCGHARMIVRMLVNRTCAEAPLWISLAPWSIKQTILCGFPFPPYNTSTPFIYSPLYVLLFKDAGTLCNYMRQLCPDAGCWVETAFSLRLWQQTEIRFKRLKWLYLRQVYLFSESEIKKKRQTQGKTEMKHQEEKSAGLKWALNNDEAPW